MMFNARNLKMNRSAFSALFVAAALAGNLQNATAQTINPTAQTASPRVVAGRNAPATAAKPGAITRVAPQGVPQPTGLNPQRFNANLPRMIAQPPANLAAHLLADHADFESEFGYVSEPGRWTSATTY